MCLKACLGLFLLFAVCGVTTARHVDKCNLQPSEFGPDWYKVPRPIPTGFENDPDYQNSFVHMPCAATTVFDIAVCSCTNPMTSIYNTLTKSHQDEHHLQTMENKPLDLVRTRDPVKPPSEKPVGTRLLNIRTGEVRHCPFRASSRGPEWYLVHEPQGSWLPMRCAPGTLFQKRSCTCVHRDLVRLQSEKPEDNDIVVLEDEYNNHAKDNTISESLGISVADVDFSKKKTDESVPFWRRQSNQQFGETHNTQTTDTPAVFVTLDGELSSFDTSNSFNGFDLGRDKIADEHKLLLKRLRKGPIFNYGVDKSNSPMYLDLDSKKENSAFTSKTRNVNENIETFIMPDKAPTMDKKPFRVKLNDTRKIKVAEINKAITFLGKLNSKSVKEELNKNRNGMKNDAKDLTNLMPVNDEIYFVDKECAKRPLPDRGPEWFEQYVWGVGNMAFTCHGNLVYDDKACTCAPLPGESTLNEINIPVKACTRVALPELGPEYYRTFMWRVGHVAVACHDNTVFHQDRCTCVPKTYKGRQRMRS